MQVKSISTIEQLLSLAGRSMMSLLHDSRNRVLAMLGGPAAQLAYGNSLAGHNVYRRAFLLYARAARLGLGAAQYRLGECYLLGRGVPVSIHEALRWLTQAAEAGETAAQTEIASLALLGLVDDNQIGLFDRVEAPLYEPDYDSAAYWSQMAATAGSAAAKAVLASILTSGPPDLRDVATGIAFYRESAEAGWSRGQLGYAMTLLCEGTPGAVAEAHILLQAAAESNVAAAHFMLGVLAESGAAGETDLLAAVTAYRAGAELGHAPSQFRYGLALLFGRGTEVDAFHAETWLRRAALAGEVQAAAAIGDLYSRDGDLPPNHAEAAIWFRRAAEGGHAGSARMLGRCYLRGAGVLKDIDEAARWLRLAIEGGDEAARDDMANLALRRQVGEMDQRETVAWFRRMAEADNPVAQFNLGLCLLEGVGTERDDAAATVWFERAAPTVPAAQAWCRRMQAEGRGHAPDASANDFVT
jgi:uncharacterized protein